MNPTASPTIGQPSVADGAFGITVCSGGLTNARGERRIFANTLGGLIEALEALTDKPWWWSPHTWAEGRRGADRWLAASCIALDLDWHAEWEVANGRAHPRKAAPPSAIPERLEAALLEPLRGMSRAIVAHHTPNGARLVLLLTEPITDRDLYGRAVRGAAVLVRELLRAHELLCVRGSDEGAADGAALAVAGYEIDESGFDLARVLWAPQAITPKGRRQARLHGYGAPDQNWSPEELAAEAPQSTIAPAPASEPTHPPHASWIALQPALARSPKARVTDKGVAVCCPLHPDESPSAIVFPSGVLKCQAAGCIANRAVPLDRWAETTGGRALMGGELARVLTAPVRGDVLGDYWRTLGEWSATDDWLDVAPPPMDWLLTVPSAEHMPERHVLPRGVVGMLAAGGGVGKSMALVQLAVAVATETPWLVGDVCGRFPGFTTHNEHGDRVLLALGEEDALKARRRIFQAALRLDPAARARLRERLVVLPLEAVPVGLMAERNSRAGEEARAGVLADELERRLNDGGRWALVILDPLSRFAGMETEGDNAAATRFVQVLERFAKAPGSPTVLVSHHTGQGARREGMHDATAARGVTALTDGVRWVATLTREAPPKDTPTDPTFAAAPLLKMAVTKNNYAVELWPFWLARAEGGALRTAAHDEIERYTQSMEKPAPRRDKGDSWKAL